MCGIFCSICIDHQCSGILGACARWKTLLVSRGPNANDRRVVRSNTGNNLELFASVLWHQGAIPSVQPCEDPDGNLLLWNGDVFSGLDIPFGQSDSVALLRKFREAEVFRVLESVHGPGAFIYWRKSDQKLWFARDWCGRRSLILSVIRDESDAPHFVLSSVCPTARSLTNSGATAVTCFELPAGAVFCVDLSFPASSPLEVAAFCDEPVPLDRLPGIVRWKVVQGACRWPFGKLNLTLPTEEHYCPSYVCPIDCLTKVLSSDELTASASSLLHLLENAVRVRTSTTIDSCRECLSTGTECSHCRIGVLFSGGLDSTVLASLCHRSVPLDQPIDLYNVAFVKADVAVDAPDRLTGLQALGELTRNHPERKWNFISINVTKEELEAKREERIRDLIHPSRSVLDDSIGCALWFAARGEGSLISRHYEATTIDPHYVSPARVVILGMGADEQLAGYVRHRRVANGKMHPDYRSRLVAINRELSTEMARIGTRNVGRDNRVVADHGREARFPFLDEEVHSFLNSLPVQFKLLPDLPLGIGDKIVLRFMAFKFLGLEKTAWEPKRAIQFGSRIAKLENSKEKGDDVCHRL